ncbi:tetratricopeptide repeat protein [bacterium]|nr:tetratricopeptide repeat protein [bacterium]
MLSKTRITGILFTQIILLFCSTSHALAVDSTAAIRRAYDAADYEIAVKLGHEALKSSPNNLLIHYYLAVSLAQLKRSDEALLEFQKCNSLAPDSEIGLKALEAMQKLQQYSSQKKSISVQKPLKFAHENKLDQLQRSAESEKQNVSNRFDQEVKRIQENSGLSDYEIQKKTREAFKKMQAEHSSIDERYQRSANALSKNHSNNSSSNVQENGNSRLIPHGSNTYVQNYENLSESDDYDVPTENPLKAQAKQMKTTGAKTKSNVHRGRK